MARTLLNEPSSQILLLDLKSSWVCLWRTKATVEYCQMTPLHLRKSMSNSKLNYETKHNTESLEEGELSTQITAVPSWVISRRAWRVTSTYFRLFRKPAIPFCLLENHKHGSRAFVLSLSFPNSQERSDLNLETYRTWTGIWDVDRDLGCRQRGPLMSVKVSKGMQSR